ncbi:zinc-binding dehydrogenase [Neobacillus sp. NPDC093182]|uniref:zinc-dependent alcohol dehydrogenase n=1 Tax=Neobacillus sp. NPDC093182 TaxID=3364297 RepID=UPI00382F4BBC
MKLAAIVGENQAVLIEKDKPILHEGWALVKIYAAPMCAEYKGFIHGHKNDCLGHEGAGEVVETTPGSKVKVGDRVVVMPQYPCGECEYCLSGSYIYCEHNMDYHAGTMSQYIAKPSWLLQKISDGVSYEKASLACCGLGPSHGAFEEMGINAFTTVLITGIGPVGLGAIINAKYRGARVIAVEMNEYRVNLAKELGADYVIDPLDEDAVAKIKELTNGKGPDFGIDCSGVPAAHRLLIDCVKRLGKIAFIGECEKDSNIRISPDLIRKGIHLIGSWHYNLNEYPKIMEIIQNSPHIDRFITHSFPMSRIQEAFEISASQNNGKIIIKPWE